MAKLDIDFTLIDESVVMNGFRALMKGAKLDAFKKNPVMLLMHNRATEKFTSNDNNVILPIGKWYDIRIEGDKLLAKPDFDDDDEFAQKIQKKVEKGYLNGASIWIDPVACSEDAALSLPGQTGPTITQWGLKECSIVDIPNCTNSLAIRNSAGKKIALSNDAGDNIEIIDYLKTLSPKDKTDTMDRKLLCANLDLPEDATDAQISKKLAALKTDATGHTQLSVENKSLKDKIIELNTAAETKKVTDLVEGAITAGKLTAGDKEDYIALATSNYDKTAAIIGKMKAYESIEGKLTAASDNDKVELESLLKFTGQELYEKGGLDRLQALSPEHFKVKYKEAFGVEFKVVKP